MAHARGLMEKDFSLAPEPLELVEAREAAAKAAEEEEEEEEEVIAGLARLATGDGKEGEGEGGRK